MDDAASPAYWIAYLDAVRASPLWQKAKGDSIESLQLGPGRRALDVGCGTGEEVGAMAAVVGAGGAAVGVDLSLAMVGEARSRNPAGGSARWFCVADAAGLPFADESFDGCRVERTLQHCADLGVAVRELVRVLRPEGRLVAMEPDWDTLVFDTPVAGVNRRIYRDVLDRSPSRAAGRRLRAAMVAAGMRDVEVRGWAVCFTSLEHAERALTLPALTGASVRAGVIAQPEAASWLDSLRQADQRGEFFASVTMFTASATKP